MGSGNLDQEKAPSTDDILREAKRRINARQQKDISPEKQKATVDANRVVYWLSDHWLLVFNVLVGLFFGGALIAPVLMHLGRTSYMNCATAKQLYLKARQTRLSREDPQGMPPVTREADQLLMELWYPYATTGKPPEIFLSPVTMDDLAAHYGVTPAAVKKLVVYRYLGAQTRDGQTLNISYSRCHKGFGNN